MLKEFKKFILRGNVVDLAVAVIIGAAFNNVVQSIVRDFITPLINALYNQHQFAKGFFVFHSQHFLYGDFINSVLSFFIMAVVIFFFVVNPINKLVSLSQSNKQTEEPTTRKCPECFSEIAKQATRCAYCTAKISAEKSD